MCDVTEILYQVERGDDAAAEQLLPLVYDELRNMAAARMAHEASDHTLQATALVHEVYLRLVDVPRAQHWQSRKHFFAAAAIAMRRILVEAARAKGTLKRGSGRESVELDAAQPQAPQKAQSLLDLDEALQALEKEDAPSARLVELRYFAGLTMAEAAETLGFSVRKAHYVWDYARSWLRNRLRE